MDSTEIIIARLVLGYLRSEGCRSAYKEFLRTSHNLRDTGLAKNKYVSTRFVGLTLEDILSEYFDMYKIVQGRLEATNYYNECHSKNTLVEQLLYLLNKVHSSRMSTPCPRSPPESNLDATSPSHIDPVSDIETTPVHTLPGNIRCSSENSYLHKGIRRKSHSKYPKSDSKASLSMTNKDDMSEVLAQTLLENKEFHEKIAQTINKYAEKKRVPGELDKTIQTVVRETEEDPIFDKILDEIIGSTTIIDANKGVESGSTSSSTAKRNCEQYQYESHQKRVHQHSDSSESHDPNYLSGTDTKKMEEQNNEAIQSIVANSRLATNIPPENQDAQSNNEVIVFDGSLDKYLISNTCNANTQTQPLHSPLYINTTGGLIMVPSANSTGNIQIDSSKQYYFLNKQPPGGWNLPSLKTPGVITEQDILAMPTVIVNDDKQPKIVTTHSLLQTPVLTTVPPSLQSIAPKPLIEIPAGYNCNTVDTHSVKTVEPVKEAGPSTVNATSTTNTLKTNTKNTESSAKSLPADLLTETPKELPELVSETIPKIIPDVVNDDTHVKTPTPQQPVKNSTPKSGSHVRNLDFSTPPKITSTQKKLIKSNRLKTPPTHKKQAAKILFKPQKETDVSKKSDDSRAVKSDVKKKRKLSDANTWDADLRAIAVAENTDEQTPKKKQDNNETKTVKKKSRKRGSFKQKMNTTEHDAALLEAALKTPVKSNITPNDVTRTEAQTDKKSGIDNEGDKKSDNERSINVIKETEVRSSKKREFTDDNSSKMILSPSKLNASKRNFVSIDLSSDNTNSKFVTPENIRDTFHHPITHAKNINLLLDTPAKTDIIPKTPGPKTPMDPLIDPNLSLTCSLFTPLTKMLEANLKGIDINSIPTPSMPITPSFPPFTPTIDLISPYSNRPTDYSTSSSYYQPSDNEQNRSLEANVIEYEKKPIKIHSDILIAKEEINVSSVEKVDNEKQICSSNYSEHLNIFNKNVIGKKNLNLMKKNLSSSSSEDESSSDTTSDDDNSKDSDENNSNTTVISRRKPDTPKRSYSLRNRTTNINNEDAKKKADTKEVLLNKKQPTKSTKAKPQPSVDAKKTSDIDLKPDTDKKGNTTNTDKKGKEKPLTKNDIKSTPIDIAQQSMLKELEEKRLRTINKFKTIDKDIPKKPARPSNSKFLKIKPIPNLNTRRKPRKSDSPKKTIQKPAGKIEKTESKTQIVSNNSKNGNLPIDLSGKEDKTKPKLPVDITNKTKDAEKTQKSTCDVEAQNLIEGLKERGIHLMQNKSPPAKKNSTATILTKTTAEDVKKESTSSNSTKNASKAEDNDEKVKETSLSTSELESELRDVYDTCAFEEENLHVIFDEKNAVVKPLNKYDTQVLTKSFLGKVFVEEIGKEIDVPLAVTPFIVLLDIPPASETTQKERKASQKRDNKIESLGKSCKDSDLIKDVNSPYEENSKLDDDLMNYAIVGSAREENSDGLDSPKSKKRKLRDEENSHTEKKCKTLLKKINVDSFLNNIHGGS